LSFLNGDDEEEESKGICLLRELLTKKFSDIKTK
jgi:hypothetical protein